MGAILRCFFCTVFFFTSLFFKTGKRHNRMLYFCIVKLCQCVFLLVYCVLLLENITFVGRRNDKIDNCFKSITLSKLILSWSTSVLHFHLGGRKKNLSHIHMTLTIHDHRERTRVKMLQTNQQSQPHQHLLLFCLCFETHTFVKVSNALSSGNDMWFVKSEKHMLWIRRVNLCNIVLVLFVRVTPQLLHLQTHRMWIKICQF